MPLTKEHAVLIALTFTALAAAKAEPITITYSFTGAGTVVGSRDTTLTLDTQASGSILSASPGMNAAWNPISYSELCVLDFTTNLLQGNFTITFQDGDTLTGTDLENDTAVDTSPTQTGAGASADRSAYVINIADQFGTMDLTTESFQQIGSATPQSESGLVPGPNGSVLTLTVSGNLDAINPATTAGLGYRSDRVSRLLHAGRPPVARTPQARSATWEEAFLPPISTTTCIRSTQYPAMPL